ncbi:MAG: flagellar L-ring protein [Pseudobdellovibrio sp.]|jgi:flagellar L-ring protein precursor FlgH|nr:flagellar L-ring protein [Pseudobdellovibrio sp.]
MIKRLLAVICVLGFQGCATFSEQGDAAKEAQLEKELTPEPAEQVVKAPVKEITDEDIGVKEPLTRYSGLNNMAPPSDRQYKRMTRERMEEESALNSSAGSLWKMEGQTSYLFAENKHRREGDPTTIKLEGSAFKLVENKAQVVGELLTQLDEQRRVAEEEERKAEAERQRLATVEAERKLRAERIAKGEIVVDPLDEQQAYVEQKADGDFRLPASVGGAAPVAGKKAVEEKIDLKDIENIPAKIVERMPDDTYRIRGQQFITIKKKPYKLIATALIRAEDFNDASVSSNKLLEAQYDLVHVKRASNE